MENNIEKNIFILTEDQKKIELDVKKLLKMIIELSGVNGLSENIGKITSDLKKKYPDFEKYYLYQIIIGSSPHLDDCLYFDFPKEDSIYETLQKGMENLLSKF